MDRLPENTHVRMMVITFYLLLLAGFLYLFARWLLPWCLPFLLAWGLSCLLEPAVAFCARTLPIRRRGASLLVLAGVIFGLGSLCFLLLRRAWLELAQLVLALPGWGEVVAGRLQIILTAVIDRFYAVGIPVDFPEDLYTLALTVFNRLSALIPGIASTLFAGLKNIGLILPQTLLFLAAFLLSGYFFCKDHAKIRQAALERIPSSLKPYVNHMRKRLFSTLSSYCKAQLMLLTITFLELLIGLTLAGVDCVVLSAACIALIDLLPFIGSGIVLLPWSLYAWAGGDGRTALILVLLYLCILLVRQLTEPQLISQSIGLYPVATLIALYIGFQAAGFWGVLLGPLCLILLQFFLLECQDFLKKRKNSC